jgi:RNA:NAD 2'-phosphotransferase (TPT1/KptA family)
MRAAKSACCRKARTTDTRAHVHQASNGVWLTKHVPPEFLNFEGHPPGASCQR